MAVMCKLAFALPALGIALSTRQRREATLTLILAVVVFAIASVAAFGNGVWRDAVHAQSQVGRASLHYVGGLIAQGAWNELPLALPAAAGVWLVWTHREQPLGDLIAPRENIEGDYQPVLGASDVHRVTSMAKEGFDRRHALASRLYPKPDFSRPDRGPFLRAASGRRSGGATDS